MHEETNRRIINALKAGAPFIGILGAAYVLNKFTNGGNTMRVHFLNVGDGHCTHIKFPNGKDMIIDSFLSVDGTNIVRHLKRNGITTIDYLVITHPHIDHFRGITELHNNFGIGGVWYTDFKYMPDEFRSEEDRIEFKNYYEILKAKGTPVYDTDNGYIGDVFIRCINPTKAQIQAAVCNKPTNEIINNLSLVVYLEYGNFKATIPGDNHTAGWEEIMSRRIIPKLDLFLASHHGQKSGYHNEFMKRASPTRIVFSSGSKKQYDAYDNYYPHTKQIHTTRSEGDIVFDCYPDGTCRKV